MTHLSRIFLASLFLLSACNQSSLPQDSSGGTNTVPNSGSGNSSTTPQTSPTPQASATPLATPSATATPSAPVATPSPNATPVPTATPIAQTPSYPSCVSSDVNHICIGLKIVSYQKNGKVVLTESDALKMVAGLNTIWSQCNIGFQMEKYQLVNPADRKFDYNPDWEEDGDTVRSAFQEKNTFLVVAVGIFTLQSTIAVTEMPGAGVYGTLVNSDYAKNFLTVGHELGHYQGLYHINNNANLMNPYIGSKTSALSTSQCNTARKTDFASWVKMMRTPL